MSISPPGDIVFDVMRASDPLSVAAARRKLARADGASDTGRVRSTITPTAGAPPRRTFNADAARTSLQTDQAQRNAGVAGQDRADRLTAGQQFESMVLQGFVDKMLPRNSAHTFGSGTAGSVWKSQMSAALANQVAATGTLGLGDMVVSRTAAHSQPLDVPQAVQTGHLVGTQDGPAGSDATRQAGADEGYPATGASIATVLSRLQEMILDALSGADDSMRAQGLNSLAKWRHDA